MAPEDEEFERIAQRQLAELKKSTKATTEDAAVRAVHKVMAEFNAKSDHRLMESPPEYPENFIDALKFDVAKRDSEARLNLDPTPISGWGRQSIGMAVNQSKQDYLAGVPPMLPQMRDGETIVVAQPEQEPVAWLIWLHGPAGHFDHKQFAEMEFERRNKEYPDPDRKLLPLYTSPPQRKPLTDEEILSVARDHYNPHQRPEISFARAIEAAHGIKGDA